MGLVVLQHVGSYGTKDEIRVPCIGRQVLKHLTIREALKIVSSYK